jgi:hypothetical protein
MKLLGRVLCWITGHKFGAWYGGYFGPGGCFHRVRFCERCEEADFREPGW